MKRYHAGDAWRTTRTKALSTLAKRRLPFHLGTDLDTLPLPEHHGLAKRVPGDTRASLRLDYRCFITAGNNAMSIYISPQFAAYYGVTGVVLDRSGLSATLRKLFSVSRTTRSRQQKEHVEVKLIDTFFSQFPEDVLLQLFDNAHDTQWPVRLLFMDPLSAQAQLRARLLNDCPIRRSNAGLFKILATMKHVFSRERASESDFNAKANNVSFLHHQVNELCELGRNNRVTIRFYTEVTTTPLYIIDNFAVSGFLMHGSQAIDGPHIVFVNDSSQDNDVFDNLNRNFDSIWDASSSAPGLISCSDRHLLFLSYSAKDEAIAKLLSEYLSRMGISTFCAAKDLRAGDPFKTEIRRALVNSRAIAVVLSENSLNSEWVTTEWGAAWALEKPIFPLLHGVGVDKLPDRLRDLQSVDISEYEKIAAEIMSAYAAP